MREVIEPDTKVLANQLVVPFGRTKALWQDYHRSAGHASPDKVLSILRRRFFWVGMGKAVHAWTTECPTGYLEFDESTSVNKDSPFIVGSMAPSQAGSDKPQPAYEAMHLLLERIVAALGFEWSDYKLLIPICPQFAVALRESWTRVQTAALSWRRSRPRRETTPCMANQGTDQTRLWIM